MSNPETTGARGAETIRVMIVEDHQMVAESLQMALQSDPAIEVVALAATVADAVLVAREVEPDLIVMDYGLPDGTGTEAAAAIMAELPAVIVVFASAEASDEALLGAVEAGASGYVLKSRPAADLIDAVRRAAAGEMLIPARELSRLLVLRQRNRRSEAERKQMVDQLTPRELDIVKLMATGLDSADIADQIHIELTTVRWHVQNILQKLGVHSKLAAVARAAEYELVDRRP